MVNNLKSNKIEKYISVSDFLGYILDNRDIFLQEMLEGVQSKEEQDGVLHSFIGEVLLHTQDCIDFDKTVALLIENKLHQMIIDELFG